MRNISAISIAITVASLMSGCGDTASAPLNSSAFNSGNNALYVASGPCYGGGVTVSTGPSNTVVRYNLSTGSLEQVVIDYNALAPGDSPVAISDYDANHLLVLIENTAGRRVDLVNKDGSGNSTFIVNSTALSSVLRSIATLSDLSLLVSKSTAIEKFNPAKARILSGANPYVNAPAGSCATSTTLISSITPDSLGNIVYTHAAATPNNKIGVVKSTGYSTTTDCMSGTAAPTTTALPTRALFHPDGKLLVAYGSATLTSNFIYSYDYTASSGALSNATAVYNDGGTIVNGPSSMAVDPTTGDVFVANVTSTYNTIERFHFVNNALTRATSLPFISYGIYTRCVSDMKVMP